MAPPAAPKTNKRILAFETVELSAIGHARATRFGINVNFVVYEIFFK